MRGFWSCPEVSGVLQTAVAVCNQRLFWRHAALRNGGRNCRPGFHFAAAVALAAFSPLAANDLRREVARLSANDQQQDIRLSNLERNVDQLQRRIPYSPKSPSAMSAPSGKAPVGAATTVSAKAPVLPQPPETTYTVRAGDSLWRIAMNHRVSPGEIMQLNGLRSDTVQTGQKLRIPARGGSSPAPAPQSATAGKSAPSKPATVGSGSHVVAAGDTFSGIAQRYGVSQAALQQANPKVNPNVILIGTRLTIPAGAKSAASTAAAPPPSAQAAPSAAAASDSGRRHVVKTGETLTAIAAAYGVTAAAIQHANKMSNPDRLSVGQQLVIPPGGSKPANIVRSTTPVTSAQTAAASVLAYPGAADGALKPTADAARLTAPAASPGPAPQDNPRGVLIYRVHSTDTIESIAATFGTTPEKIREINRKPAGSKVEPDEEILVPAMGAVGL